MRFSAIRGDTPDAIRLEAGAAFGLFPGLKLRDFIDGRVLAQGVNKRQYTGGPLYHIDPGPL
jgi:hypothetical protein